MVLCGSLMLGGVVGLSGVVFAAESSYPDATHKTSTGTVTFKKSEGNEGPTDPKDPEKPFEPVDPINPNGAELMIKYASNLKFGAQSKSATSWNALADTGKKDGAKEISEVVPFVSIKDARGTDRKGWVLTVKQDADFKDAAGNSLTGAELTYSNGEFVNTEKRPSVFSEKIVLNKEAQQLASATAETGIGDWSLGFGDLSGEAGKQTTNGITLSVPKTTAKNTGMYSTTVTYELTADPAAGK